MIGRKLWGENDKRQLMRTVLLVAFTLGCAQIRFAMQTVQTTQVFRQPPAIIEIVSTAGNVGVYSHWYPSTASEDKRKKQVYWASDRMQYTADKSHNSDKSIRTECWHSSIWKLDYTFWHTRRCINERWQAICVKVLRRNMGIY